MEEVLDAPQEEAAVLTPGVLLERARLAKNLTQEEVAKKLKLSTQSIKDIESNDYTYASALIYAQGYLRSYARLVEISPESVLEAFDKSGLSSQFDKTLNDGRLRIQQSVVVSSGTRSWADRQSRAVRWVGLVLGASLVLMVVAWWQGQGKQPPAAPVESAMSVDSQALPINSEADQSGA